ncbi:MAG: mechanosensitive ion channel family protein [Actinobacteria bacterium]|jgi:small-conductance mechanosensitive channel|nr:mechanosensitive ion channel family protein [Actinomycetota bacterium]MDA2952054.1 mechanosensitive ion channel family protein [Actinomycetota bacterium]MDA2998924.1 mechanosensitive ion channel family protein [Actinomycetota bacterium]
MNSLAVILAATGRDTVSQWLRVDLVAIVMIVSGAHVLMRLVAFIADQQILSVRNRNPDSSDLSALSTGAHRAAVLGATRWGINFIVIAVATTSVFLRLNLPSSALVFLGSVAGAGLGFGAQQMVGDIIAGLYIISERQFGVGDIVRLGPFGIVGWAEGRVEEVTLRVTKIRTFDGDLISVANGQLRQNVNMSRDWSRVLVTVPLPRESDIEKEIIRIDRVCAEMARDPKFSNMLIEIPSVQGVDSLGDADVEVRVAGRSLPVQQWKVERELRRRIAAELRSTYASIKVSGEVTA